MGTYINKGNSEFRDIVQAYDLGFYGRTFKGSMDVRPEMLYTYVLSSYGRTSREGLNEDERE